MHFERGKSGGGEGEVKQGKPPAKKSSKLINKRTKSNDNNRGTETRKSKEGESVSVSGWL